MRHLHPSPFQYTSYCSPQCPPSQPLLPSLRRRSLAKEVAQFPTSRPKQSAITQRKTNLNLERYVWRMLLARQGMQSMELQMMLSCRHLLRSNSSGPIFRSPRVLTYACRSASPLSPPNLAPPSRPVLSLFSLQVDSEGSESFFSSE